MRRVGVVAPRNGRETPHHRRGGVREINLRKLRRSLLVQSWIAGWTLQKDEAHFAAVGDPDEELRRFERRSAALFESHSWRRLRRTCLQFREKGEVGRSRRRRRARECANRPAAANNCQRISRRWDWNGVRAFCSG